MILVVARRIQARRLLLVQFSLRGSGDGSNGAL